MHSIKQSEFPRTADKGESWVKGVSLYLSNVRRLRQWGVAPADAVKTPSGESFHVPKKALDAGTEQKDCELITRVPPIQVKLEVDKGMGFAWTATRISRLIATQQQRNAVATIILEEVFVSRVLQLQSIQEPVPPRIAHETATAQRNAVPLKMAELLII